jgi:hypothetical protein
MITLHYIGAHKGGTLSAALGDKVIRWAQRGYSLPARTVTHTEALLGGSWFAATIASSSIVDDDEDGKGGVRIKPGVRLNPLHWIVLDLPDTLTRNAYESARWFKAHEGQRYDVLGAPGSVAGALLGHGEGRWFCTEAVAASMGFADPHTLCPAAFFNLLKAMGARDVTADFFGVSET